MNPSKNVILCITGLLIICASMQGEVSSTVGVSPIGIYTEGPQLVFILEYPFLSHWLFEVEFNRSLKVFPQESSLWLKFEYRIKNFGAGNLWIGPEFIGLWDRETLLLLEYESFIGMINLCLSGDLKPIKRIPLRLGAETGWSYNPIVIKSFMKPLRIEWKYLPPSWDILSLNSLFFHTFIGITF